MFDLTTRRWHLWWPRLAISDSAQASNLLPTPRLRFSRSTHKSLTQSSRVIVTPIIFDSQKATQARDQSSSSSLIARTEMIKELLNWLEYYLDSVK